MNKKYLPLALLAAASFASAALMFPVEGSRVCTGAFECDDFDGLDDGGYWFDYDDRENDGGTSYVDYPFEENEYGDKIAPMLEAFGQIEVTLNLGGAADYPFVGFGFNIVNGNKDPYDIGANWGTGVCVTIANDAKMVMELEYQGDGALTEYNEYNAPIPASATMRAVDLPFSTFKQESGWGLKVSQDDLLAATTAVKLKLGGSNGDEVKSNLKIAAFGTLGTCPSSGSNSIKAGHQGSALKSQLSGRTLQFRGLKNSANVEVINLQGQVVMNSVINGASALNLSKLDAGVYMVRATGTSVNFAQKILLK